MVNIVTVEDWERNSSEKSTREKERRFKGEIMQLEKRWEKGQRIRKTEGTFE